MFFLIEFEAVIQMQSFKLINHGWLCCAVQMQSSFKNKEDKTNICRSAVHNIQNELDTIVQCQQIKMYLNIILTKQPLLKMDTNVVFFK
jgi:hypothetical protein